jgi:hypothetical protein
MAAAWSRWCKLQQTGSPFAGASFIDRRRPQSNKDEAALRETMPAALTGTIGVPIRT